MAIDTRLLSVIKAINQLGICSVLDLHRATGISRPAVHRIVECLCANGYAKRIDNGSSIRLTSQILELSAGYKPENSLAHKAEPILERLQKEIRWPHSFATPDHDQMVIQETTRHQNPFVFDNGRTGLHLPMLPTAMGCAYLAFAEPGFVEDQIDRAKKSQQYTPEMITAALRRINQAAEKGVALRSGGLAARTSTVAVPVCIEGVAIGALCSTFPTTAVPSSEIYSRFVPILQNHAAEIAKSAVSRPH